MATAHPTFDRPQNNLRGLLLMLAGFFMFSMADLAAKILTAEFHPIQIVWTRQLGLTTAVIILIALRGPSLLRSVAPRLQIARGLCAIVSALLFVYALRYVPLADAVAVTFVAPFMVTILSALILRESVGIRRWSAVVIGFIGTLIVIRPGMGVFHPAIFLVVLAASAFAARQILSRYLGSRDRTETTLAFTAGTSILLLFPPLFFVWKTPTDLSTIGLMALMAVLAACGEFLIIKALEIALAVVVTPAHYSLILFGSFWGFMAFGHLPDGWTLIGAAIIVASGLYMMIREARLAAAK
ncbi:DMT family transporter [Falsiphaeobacter marinintestinus]|uniref:DMT family transporter n=1 Tax=Falsiphaeobacter marinintestinus TaxID=1492905 RepID=UPI001FED0762|nr:DMT family transporter [Phaeobacter marinintestinus]